MSTEPHLLAGWDIGGAHMKLALLDGESLSVFQWDCPLWKGLEYMTNLLEEARADILANDCAHAVTMTGELVDLFDNRAQGVREIAKAFQTSFPSNPVYFYKGSNSFVSEVCDGDEEHLASANWQATAYLAAHYCDDAIIMDMGSTTTDLIPIRKGKLESEGFSDYARLRAGELVYTGVVRSPVNTICHEVPYDGAKVPMVAEYFATTADVYRVLSSLPSDADLGVTADGQAKNVDSSARRIARMLGLDYVAEDLAQWEQVAAFIAEKQQQKIEQQIIRMQTRVNLKSPLVVGTGIGRFIAKDIAKRLGLDYIDYADLVVTGKFNCTHRNAADCAPAVAVAILLKEDLSGH